MNDTSFDINQVAEVKLSYSTKVKASQRPKILHSKDAYDIFIKHFNEDEIEYRESFKILLLNTTNRVLGINHLSFGGTAGTVVDIKFILQAAILTNASSLVLCHNHPSGNLTPSNQDKKLTEQIKNAAKLMDISLLDHLIVSYENECFFSFADEGIL